jgi:hypothetical protein
MQARPARIQAKESKQVDHIYEVGLCFYRAPKTIPKNMLLVFFGRLVGRNGISLAFGWVPWLSCLAAVVW